METLVERICRKYSSWKIAPAPELMTYAMTCDEYSLDRIGVDELQTGLCEYMDSSASRSRALSEALGRTKEPPMADVFTEATNMLVDAMARSPGLSDLNIKVFSEKNLNLPRGGYLKPDVSIWKGDKLAAVVECKTSLGRRRQDWLMDYEKRAEDLSTLGLSSSALFLLVETEQTWGGFPASDTRTSTTWFTLCPQGSWHGGGKTGESKLQEKQYPNVVKKLRQSIEKTLFG